MENEASTGQTTPLESAPVADQGHKFFIVRIAVKQEKITAMMLSQKVKAKKAHIYSIFFKEEIRGYLFVEADDDNAVANLVDGVKHVKGMIKGNPLSFADVQKMIERKEEVSIAIEPGDIVEIVSGPFKGERAKVNASDIVKNIYTVVPIDAAISIPVNISGKNIRLKTKREDIEREDEGSSGND
ncbi:MAG: transcription elongation factor Spt5 [Candidatus Micrarchaeota archaeon]|nr:transcription elongation factor Spt5 [Candidatus Micrarchaeota archaeon]